MVNMVADEKLLPKSLQYSSTVICKEEQEEIPLQVFGLLCCPSFYFQGVIILIIAVDVYICVMQVVAIVSRILFGSFYIISQKFQSRKFMISKDSSATFLCVLYFVFKFLKLLILPSDVKAISYDAV